MKNNSLEITNEIMKIGTEIYRIDNLVRIGKQEEKAEDAGLVFFLLLAIGGTLFLGLQAPGSVSFGLGAIIVLSVIISLRKSKYALRLETNSNSGKILWSKKEEDIDSLIALIASVMEIKNQTVKYTVNMNDFSVKDIIIGDKFKNIKDAVLAARRMI